nr:hypothetical protein [Tanacetum cinerariifolium]
MSIQEMEDLKQQYLDEMKRLTNSEYRDEIKIDELKGHSNSISIEINKNEKLQQLEQVANLSTYPSKRFNSFCYDDDDDEDYTIVITPDFLITDSLIMKNEHLATILKTESDEFIKSSVENLIPIPSEFEDFSDITSECDMPDCDDSQSTKFSTFSNPLFDDSTSIDDESSHEEVIHEMSFKTYLNPLFDLDEEIISSEFNLTRNEDLNSTPKNDRFDTKSYLLESLLNHDTLMASSPKFDSLLEEFSGELAHTDLIPPGINEAFYDDHVKEISSGSTTTHSDSSLYDSFIFGLSINPFPHANNSDFYEFIDELTHIISPPDFDLILRASASLGHDPGNLGDKIICDLDKTPDLSQQSPQNCPKCGHPVDDSFEPSNDNTNVANALREPFVVNQDHGENSSQSPPQINHRCCYECGDPLEGIFCHQCTCELCGNGAHYGYNYPSKVSIVPNLEPFNNQTVKELPPIVPSFNPTCYSEDGNSFTYDSTSNLVHDSPNVFDPPSQPQLYSCEFCENDARYGHYCTAQVPFIYPEPCYNQNFNFPQEFHDFQLQDLCCENHRSFSDEDIPKKIYLNPLFDKEIISMKIDPHHFNVESDLVESLLNRDSLIISSFSKIDSLFDEFADELTLFKSIPPGINETDRDLEEETHFIKRLLYDNSSPCPPKEFVFENSDAAIESVFPSHIPVEDSDSLMEEIDLSFTLDYPIPSGIEEDDYESERDILILEELLSNDSFSLPKNESFHFDIPSSSRPPAKPPDGNTGILNVKVMGDISKQKVPMPRLMFTQSTNVPNQEKSPDLLPHLGRETF